ncbi:MAG TPA: PEP-CTERM sorting domain-containing protein [Bryobacteraceae bacterium]|nr:PEP-CTERM sorting domain-containing protein [Bryobacteraceae bacterium]
MKYLGLAAIALAMTATASADTFTETCTSASGALGATSFSATLLTCAQFSALPSGYTLLSVTINLEDSFNQGVPTQTNGFDFIYTNVDPDVNLQNGPFPTNSCITVGTGSSSTCEDQVTGTIGGGDYYQLGNVITTNLAAYLGSGNFNVADVAGSIDNSINPNSALQASGSLAATAFATFTYANLSAPEPGSMMLLGSGLVAFALIGRKLVRK